MVSPFVNFAARIIASTMRVMRQYVTTAIDYPNAPPHLGHVLEKVLADVIVRWMRLRGDDVRFQIGTDEHGSKIQRKAEHEGMTPREFVDRNVKLFVALYDQLHISSDDFFRTTDRTRHWPTVLALWERLREGEMLEKRTYTGLYCSGCERFLTRKELVDGSCPDHRVPPEEIKEENWFYALSRDRDFLRNLLGAADGLQIVPEYRGNEVRSLLERGLEDTSFSRPRSSVSWGIPVPGGETQTMYVWCDALTNYISSLGFFTDHEQREWWDDATVTHVIGKDIARFHALLWPSMLHRAGVKTPNRLLIHGFITNEGQKMSKTLGNVVEPRDILAHFGGDPDPLRFFLCHEVAVGNDGDFAMDRLIQMYDAKLRNQLGNLLNRVLVLLAKDGRALAVPGKEIACTAMDDVWQRFAMHMDAFEASQALQVVFDAVVDLNKWMNDAQPWALTGSKRAQILGALAESLRHIALLLLPFMPGAAQRMSAQIGLSYANQMLAKDFVITEEMRTWRGVGEWKAVGAPAILFPPLS